MKCHGCNRRTTKGFRIKIVDTSNGNILGILCPACADEYNVSVTEVLVRDNRIIKKYPPTEFDVWLEQVIGYMREYGLQVMDLPNNAWLHMSFESKTGAQEAAWRIVEMNPNFK